MPLQAPLQQVSEIVILLRSGGIPFLALGTSLCYRWCCNGRTKRASACCRRHCVAFATAGHRYHVRSLLGFHTTHRNGYGVPHSKAVRIRQRDVLRIVCRGFGHARKHCIYVRSAGRPCSLKFAAHWFVRRL